MKILNFRLYPYAPSVTAFAFMLFFFCFSLDSQAQVLLDNDKIYESIDTPSPGLNTYEFKLMSRDFNKEITDNPNYVALIKQKWEARSEVQNLSVDVTGMKVTAVIPSNTSPKAILKVLHMLNPNASHIVAKPK